MGAFIHSIISFFTENKWKEVLRVSGAHNDASVKEVLQLIIDKARRASELEQNLSELNQKIQDNDSKIAKLNCELKKAVDENNELLAKNESQLLQIHNLQVQVGSLNDNISQQQTVIKDYCSKLLQVAETTMDAATNVYEALVDCSSPELQAINATIITSLQKLGIKPLTSTGCMFDNNRHKVVTIRPTNDSSLDGIVAESLGIGFMREDKCLRQQDVIIYKYQPDN